MRVAAGQVLELHQLQHFLYALVAVVGVDFLHAQAEGNVLLYGHVGEQRVALEHHADLAFLRAQGHDVLAIQEDLATVHRGKPGDTAQQGDLPQPDGPSRVTNSPLATSQLISLNTGVPV